MSGRWLYIDRVQKVTLLTRTTFSDMEIFLPTVAVREALVHLSSTSKRFAGSLMGYPTPRFWLYTSITECTWPQAQPKKTYGSGVLLLAWFGMLYGSLVRKQPPSICYTDSILLLRVPLAQLPGLRYGSAHS